MTEISIGDLVRALVERQDELTGGDVANLIGCIGDRELTEELTRRVRTDDDLNNLNALDALLEVVSVDKLIEALTERRDELADAAAVAGNLVNTTSVAEEVIADLMERFDIEEPGDLNAISPNDPAWLLAVEAATAPFFSHGAATLEELRRELASRGILSRATVELRARGI